MATAIPYIALAIGAGVSAYGAQESASSMEDAQKAELTRQRDYQKRAKGVFQEVVKQSTPEVVKRQMDEGTQHQMEQYQKLQQTPLTSSAAASPAQDSAKNAMVSALSNRAAAPIGGGIPNWNILQAIKDLKARTLLGIVGNTASRSQSVLPFELRQASHAGDPFKFAGQGISTLGGLYGAYSSLNAPKTPNTTVGPGDEQDPSVYTDYSRLP